MFAVLRALLTLVAVLAAVAFFMGYSWRDVASGARGVDRPAVDRPASADPGEAHERAGPAADAIGDTAERAGQRAAQAASEAGEILSDAALTAKIKSKMALDDHVRAGEISVSTTDGRVTLTGRVGGEDERRRAVELARDTRGVLSVDDRLTIGR